MSYRSLPLALCGLAAFGLAACDSADGPATPESATGVFDAAVFADADELIVSVNRGSDDRAFRYRNPDAFARKTAFFRQRQAGPDVTSFQTIKFDEFQNEFFATLDVSTGTGGRIVRYSRQGAELASNDGVLVSPKGFDIGFFSFAPSEDARVLFVADVAQAGIFIFDPSLAGGEAFNEPVSRAWDVHYNQDTDLLFAANTDGTVSVYSIITGPDPIDQFQLFAPDGTTPAVNNHGITYDADTQTLIVSDVGAAGSADDGAIHVVDYDIGDRIEGGALDTPVTARATYAGASTLLGNPVDIAGSGSSIFVAEKANNGGRMLRFDDVLAASGFLNVAPDGMDALDNPESVDVLDRSAFGQQPGGGDVIPVRTAGAQKPFWME